MKKARLLILGLIISVYIILFGPMAYFGAKLWTDIIFGELTNTSTITLLWSSAFFYCLIALIFVLPGIGIVAFKMQIEDERISI